MSKVEQTISTRNQSTANYSQKRVFVFDNRFKEEVFKNAGEGVLNVTTGLVVTRNTDGTVSEVTADTVDKVIGVLKTDGDVSLGAGLTTNINIGTKGMIDGNMLTLPAGVTLKTQKGGKTLGDYLEDQGLHVDTSSVEHTKFDN